MYLFIYSKKERGGSKEERNEKYTFEGVCRIEKKGFWHVLPAQKIPCSLLFAKCHNVWI